MPAFTFLPLAATRFLAPFALIDIRSETLLEKTPFWCDKFCNHTQGRSSGRN